MALLEVPVDAAIVVGETDLVGTGELAGGDSRGAPVLASVAAGAG
jgi:hypothetical protein